MIIKILENVNIEKITDAFNLSFSDYFVSIHLTSEQMKSKMRADKINPGYSVGVFDGENLIALILHGLDEVNSKKVIYNGGTGVVPEKRGQRLTQQMYEFILPKLKERGIDYLVLEVISKNIQAIKSYKKSGYKIVRELRCYKGQINSIKKNNDLKIEKLTDYNWAVMQSFWDLVPTWQNSVNVVDELKGSNRSIGAYVDNQLVGYLIYNPSNNRIHQIAVNKNFRRMGVASTLIDCIAKEYGNNLSVINIDKDTEPTNAFLFNLGFENYLDQMEMRLDLK